MSVYVSEENEINSKKYLLNNLLQHFTKIIKKTLNYFFVQFERACQGNNDHHYHAINNNSSFEYNILAMQIVCVSPQ